MIIDNIKHLELLSTRLIPEKFSGTTFERIIKNFLTNINTQYQYIDHFTNRMDINKIETTYNDTEINSYVDQYTYILKKIMNIDYPNLIKNGEFRSGIDFWGTELKYKTIEVKSGLNIKTKTILVGQYNILNESFVYTRNTIDYSIYDKLYQDQVIGGDKNNFEISFTVTYIDPQATLKVYAGVVDNNNLMVSYSTSTIGLHTFRISFDNYERYTGDDKTKLIFEFNGSVTIKNIFVQEYGRIQKNDLQLLASQLIQNKGKLSSYVFLFNLLTNLGSQSNLDLAINIDQWENASAFTKPRINISEIFLPARQNIKYNETITKDGDDYKYFFGRQGEYEVGGIFKEYVSSYNIEKVVPFKYQIDATFSNDIFEEYIMPIVHPVGWEILYNVYKLVEMVDSFETIPQFSEVDLSKYSDVLYTAAAGDDYYYTSNINVSNCNKIFIINTNSIDDENMDIGNLVIENSTEYWKTIFDADNIEELQLLDLSKYLHYMYEAFGQDDIMNEFSYEFSTVYDENIFSALGDSGIDTLNNITINIPQLIINDLWGDSTLANFDDSAYLDKFIEEPINIETYDLGLVNPNEENIAFSSKSVADEYINDSIDVIFGSSLKFDAGGDVKFGNSIYKLLENDAINVQIVPKTKYWSDVTSADIFTNDIVYKIEGYGHGDDNKYYMYINSSSLVGVNLNLQNFNNTGLWFCLSNRQPS